ncbi:phosphatidylserine decarboxylase family protein [Planosporangium mesophilum]|uniref:phosphatidylserine decarboxylase family protein n=1 Tax=Planosporangium mesophilum TaxID=689768 RepID=UPI001438AC7F|nr:phosphatidylserine decarboxylase family protein [Planosporangium mesophilum]NJC81469.1 phosphatidylserine decarboxylase [Planosporangium mesophilum]
MFVTMGDEAGDLKRRGGWLPQGQDELERWLDGRIKSVGRPGVFRHPVIREFAHLIETDAIVRMYVTRMIDEVPKTRKYSKRHIASVDQLLHLIDEVITTAPEFSEGAMVTTPLTGILDWTMGTTAGMAAYRDPRVNAILKKVLDAWAEFLNSPESLYVLNDSPQGWMSPTARQAVGIDQFEHDPDDKHWGFTSWNDFFTRRLRPGARPVAAPDDDSVIVSACESTPYRISRDVARHSEFWIKAQPYSLQDMLANDDAVDEFVGGTVYQGFLSALNYHRWHSPVAGTIVRAYVQPGTYFSEADSEGAEAVEASASQGYLAHVAARAIILIQADNPAIGLMAVVPIGMVEVSSCVISDDIVPGHHVEKGDELGWFQFGGSTECLVFRPGAVEDFSVVALPQPGDADASIVKVRSKLAVAAR